jgi:hypothetical protein
MNDPKDNVAIPSGETAAKKKTKLTGKPPRPNLFLFVKRMTLIATRTA